MNNSDNTYPTQTRPPKHWWRFPLFVFVFSRLIIFPTAYVSQLPLPEDWDVNVTERAAHYPYKGALGMWVRWDAVWYISIADIGYDYAQGEHGSTGFFPAYPLVIRLFKPVFGNTILTGLLVANALFLASLFVLFRFLHKHITKNSSTIHRSLMYLAVYPSAFYFAAPYSESLFLLVSIIAIWAAYERKWWLAGLAGAVASASRLQGILLMLPVGIEWAAMQGWTFQTALKSQAWRCLINGLRADFRVVIMLATTMPLGLIAYVVYLWRRFGAPLAFLEAQQTNTADRDYLTFSYNLDRLAKGHFDFFWVGVIVAVAFVILAYFVWQRFGASLGSYCLISVLTPMIGSVYTGIPRYSTVLFPVFVLLAFWGRRRWLDRLIMIFFPLVLALFTFLYVQWAKV